MRINAKTRCLIYPERSVEWVMTMRQAIEEYLCVVERNLHPDIRIDVAKDILQRCRENLREFSRAVGNVEPITLNRAHHRFYAALLEMRGTEDLVKEAKLDDVRRFLDWLQRDENRRAILNRYFAERRASIMGWLQAVFGSRPQRSGKTGQ